jgi:hypothetical protein
VFKQVTQRLCRRDLLASAAGARDSGGGRRTTGSDSVKSRLISSMPSDGLPQAAASHDPSRTRRSDDPPESDSEWPGSAAVTARPFTVQRWAGPESGSP